MLKNSLGIGRSYALVNGYSLEAAAGILGNIQGEVGASMNPDTEQGGGPAYGWTQWDGSAYPLIGSPTWNGREYVLTFDSCCQYKRRLHNFISAKLS